MSFISKEVINKVKKMKAVSARKGKELWPLLVFLFLVSLLGGSSPVWGGPILPDQNPATAQPATSKDSTTSNTTAQTAPETAPETSRNSSSPQKAARPNKTGFGRNAIKRKMHIIKPLTN